MCARDYPYDFGRLKNSVLGFRYELLQEIRLDRLQLIHMTAGVECRAVQTRLDNNVYMLRLLDSFIAEVI